MFCSICSTSQLSLMLRRSGSGNLICEDCYDGAQNIITLVEKENVKAKSCSKSLLYASKWAAGLTETQGFLREMADAYRNLTPSDILLKPGNDGSPIATHRALLALRSKIFKTMLESDTCKPLPMETITLSELNHEELEALIEFLYRWSLPEQKLEKHIYPLLLAAHKYEIISLQEFCENYMLKTLNSGTALMVLEISDFCSLPTTRDKTLRFIVKHVKDIVISSEYEAFAVKNPHLSVQITRALMMDANKRKREFYRSDRSDSE